MRPSDFSHTFGLKAPFFSFDMPLGPEAYSQLFMTKYLAVALLPLIVSCNSTKRVAERLGDRPSQKAFGYATEKTNKGLNIAPGKVVDVATDVTLDVAEDSTAYVGDVYDPLARRSTTQVLSTARRGANLTRREARRGLTAGHDISDEGLALADAEIGDTLDLGLTSVERTAYSGGSAVDTTMRSYSNIWDRTTRAIFGGLLRGTVRNTKPYMVGSIADETRERDLPGSGFKKEIPDFASLEPAPAAAPAASAKAVTASK